MQSITLLTIISVRTYVKALHTFHVIFGIILELGTTNFQPKFTGAKPRLEGYIRVFPDLTGLICQMESQTQHITVVKLKFIRAKGTLCLATTEILKGKQAVCYTLYLYRVGTANLFSAIEQRNTLKAKLSDTSKSLTSQSIRPS